MLIAELQTFYLLTSQADTLHSSQSCVLPCMHNFKSRRLCRTCGSERSRGPKVEAGRLALMKASPSKECREVVLIV